MCVNRPLHLEPVERFKRKDDDQNQLLWDAMAEELVELIANHLDPGCKTESPWLSVPLSNVPTYYADSSVGAAHWNQLSKALSRRGQWVDTLRKNRRDHDETTACCRLLNAFDEQEYDCASHRSGRIARRARGFFSRTHGFFLPAHPLALRARVPSSQGPSPFSSCAPPRPRATTRARSSRTRCRLRGRRCGWRTARRRRRCTPTGCTRRSPRAPCPSSTRPTARPSSSSPRGTSTRSSA